MSETTNRAPTALVTGAARGIGRATVTQLVDRGWRVVAGVRDTAAAGFSDPSVHVVAMDVTDPEAVRAGVADAEAFAGGALSAVVNNAGYAMIGAVEDMDVAEAREMFETNTFGALAVVQAAVPGMRRAGRGRIVFVSTVGAHLPTPFFGAYRASKAALNAFAEQLSLETRAFGLRVSRIEPGMVATDFGRSTRRTGSFSDPDGPYADLAEAFRGALGRWRGWVNTPEDEVAARVVAHVVADDVPAAELVGTDADHLFGMDEDRLLEFLGIDWPRRPPSN